MPVAVFLALFIGSGVILNDFYAMPAIVAFLAALAVAFAQNPKRSFEDKLESVGGAMFGDNLSVISDTTIAATRTQGCDMKDKFRENFLIALPAPPQPAWQSPRSRSFRSCSTRTYLQSALQSQLP